MRSKPLHFSIIYCLGLFIVTTFTANADFYAPGSKSNTNDPVKLENPMTVSYLKKRLRKNSPRLVLTPSLEKNLRKKLANDPVIKNMYGALLLNAQEIQKKPLLQRKKIGRRLLSVSREMLYRMNVLGMVYRIDKSPEVLQRIDKELTAVCNFQDWNPSHYLDVAEMAMAVAFAVDWAGEDLPPATVTLAKKSLIEKGINPSYNKKGNVGWINGTNNWNQVCHGGMIAAAITVAEVDPELATKTISRALDGMPHALTEYGPDGVYPEGSTYWGYGTGFSVVTSSMLESAFGTDFGLAAYPSFMQSADFRVLCTAPTDMYYNFADCGDQRGENGDLILAWFAAKTGNTIYYEKERFLKDPQAMGKLSRHAGAGLVWLSQIGDGSENDLPLAWKGEGTNPVVFFRGGKDDPRQYYFGGKGGRGTISHGNMDAGSFVFELDGIRWVIDSGNQGYHDLEKTGFKLWGRCQHCERWTLLTKNNFGHSTLTVNDALHHVDGFAAIVDFKDGNQPEATLDMSKVFGNKLKNVTRRFVKGNDHSLLIEDKFELTDSTRNITWQLMTTADVTIVPGGAILKQDGKQLKLEHLSHPGLTVSVISLDPPPLKLDRVIKNLKRVEIRMPAHIFHDGANTIRVRLSPTM